MRVSLRVGVWKGTSGTLRALLESLGALSADVGGAPLDPSRFACLAATSPGDYAEYVRAGGVLLAPEDCWPHGTEVFGEVATPFGSDDLGWSVESRELRVESRGPDSPVPTLDAGLSALESRLSTLDSRLSTARLCFRLARFGAGYCVEVPRRLLDECWTSREAGMKHFSSGSAVDAMEVSSAYDKANIQKTLLWAMQKCYALRRLPCLTKDRVPAGASNVFCYRLDCDGGPRRDFQNAISALANDIPHQTYFFAVFEYERRPDLARAITERGGVVDSHGYVHVVFSDPDVERRNLAKAHDWIARHTGRSPLGYVCPYFGYNAEVLATLEAMGYRYYSSFGLDYDVLPHRIVVGDRLTGLWNLSYHPVSLGVLLRCMGGFDGPRVQRYFQGLAAVRQERHEPHLYYCHPEFRIGRYPEVYHGLRAAVLEFGDVRLMSLPAYVEFLDRRASLAPDVSYEPETATAYVDSPEQWRAREVGLLHCGRRLRQVPVESRFVLAFSEDDQAVEWTPGVGDAVSFGRDRSRREAQARIETLARCEKHQALGLRMPKTYRFFRGARDILRKLRGAR